MFAGCHTRDVSEAERFDASVRKELPFVVFRFLLFCCKDSVFF